MVKKFKGKLIYILMFITILATLSMSTFAVENKSIQWMSYPEYLDAEADRAWLNPEVYVGYTAEINTLTYPKVWVGNMIAGMFNPYNEVSLDVTTRGTETNYLVKIVDYYVDEASDSLWYLIEPCEGVQLPQSLINHPYIRYVSNYDVDKILPEPTLLMLPRKAMFKDDILIVKNQANHDNHCDTIVLNKDQAPDFFEVDYVYSTTNVWYGYDLGDITSWDDSVEDGYRYVDEESVILIPSIVSSAYEDLMNAENPDEFKEIYESIPEDILDMFSPLHKENIEEQEQELIRLENIEYSTTVDVNGVLVPVTVKGRIPVTGVELSVTTVDNMTVVREGFEIQDMSDLIAALDIKIINTKDGSEWQPDSNSRIWVNIGVGALGYEDGRILRLDHKHGDKITVYDEVIVMKEEITIVTYGFSIFTVQNVGDTNRVGTNFTNDQTMTLEIGDKKVIYCDQSKNQDGTWEVEDTSGAIHYTVHTQSAAGHDGVYAPWIEVVCLKESKSPVKLTYRYPNSTETVYLDINIPTSKIGAKDLYITDDVNRTGRIIVSLCDNQGNDISSQLEGASFSWTRSDNLFITPRAYGDNSYDNDGSGVANSSINIAKDHAGLVEARKNGNTYTYVTYTVEAILADGTELDANYTVYYQSEFINANFEFPEAAQRNYTYFVNGQAGLYWKTTAPGSSRSNQYEKLTMDIEIAEVTNFWNGEGKAPNDSGAGTQFGVARAADHEEGGTQFAELNAEAFGALYQDIISVPHEDIEWEFSHAPRQDQTNNSGGWGTKVSNAMFIIIGATENAQQLTTQNHLTALGARAKEIAGNDKDFLAGKKGIQVEDFTYNNDNYGDYMVWYHNAGTIASDARDNEIYAANGVYGKNNGYGWTDLKGSYTTPDDQYRTRLFFVSEPSSNTGSLNAGNLIDNASGGIYKTYLIEYYEESFDAVTNLKTVKHLDQYDEKGRALIYSSEKMDNLDIIETKDGDYLHRILINGESYPYEIRSTDPVTGKIDASIYIEKYSGKAEYVTINGVENRKNNYNDYQIVVQVYVRDTVIAIEKTIEWPKDDSNNELMTPEQKLEVITNLLTSTDTGYKTIYDIRDTENNVISTDSAIVIKNRSPDGGYTGYIAPDNNPPLNKRYIVTETYSTPIPGLELKSVTLKVTRFRYGVGLEFDKDEDETTNNYIYDVIGNGQYRLRGTSQIVNKLSTDEIYLSDLLYPGSTQPGYKVAEIDVINTYTEKLTTIEYKAVGNGKVAFIGVSDSDLDYVDTPTETLAFYSGSAQGAAVHPGNGATFVGWFTDPECKNPVQTKDGVVYTNGNFKPNANILNAEKVTFYAKFVSGSLTINRTNAKAGQIFVYHITGTDGLDIYVSIECDENGNGSKTISEIIDSDYTVTEITDFSWRYPDPIDSSNSTIETTIVKTEPDSESGKPLEFIFNFDGERQHIYWVNAFSDIKKNIYKALTGGS